MAKRFITRIRFGREAGMQSTHAGRAAPEHCRRFAADYRINIYLRQAQAIYVNLYVPSTLRWTENGSALTLTQEGDYPFEDRVTFSMTSSRPTELTLHFRIPEWAKGASIRVNGARQQTAVVPGQFAAVRREWKTGDSVELELPLKMRLEPIDRRHPDTVALLRGPLVLMAVKPEQGSSVPRLTREQLLAARPVSERQWEVSSPSGPLTLLPFTSLGERPYWHIFGWPENIAVGTMVGPSE